MNGPYGNQVVQIDGVDPRVVAMAAERLMPPQYDEFCASMIGGCSVSTRSYWSQIAESWLEVIQEDEP